MYLDEFFVPYDSLLETSDTLLNPNPNPNFLGGSFSNRDNIGAPV